MESGRTRQFHIHDCLGRGGYGEVYRATMVAPGGVKLDVAVKLLRVDLDPGNEAVHRLRDEARLLSALRHPAILQVFDLAMLDGRIGLITEYVEGEDLSTLIEPGAPPLPLRALVEIAATVAEALDAAWGHPGSDGTPLRLVHRDVKPSNIRIGRHGEIKLLDFGIARSMAETSDREARTGTGSTVGSLAYMAPERFGRAPVGPSADIFGLGCVLFEGIARRRLFVDPVPVEMFRLAADRAAFDDHVDAAMAGLPADLPPELVTLIRQMLAYRAENRPSPREVRSRCEILGDQLPGEPVRRWARDRTWRPTAVVSGYLEGRVITEGTLSHHSPPTLTPTDTRSSETFRIELGPSDDPPKPALAPAVAPVGRWPHPALWVAVGAVGVAIGMGLVAIGAWSSGPTDPPPPIERPLPVPVPVPVPVVVPAPPPPPPTPPPAPAPAPAPRERPRPAPAPAPAPMPVQPAPAPVPAPAPAPVRYGTVVATPDTVKVVLVGNGSTWGPGQVPAGRYELRADFGNGSGLATMSRYVDVVDGGRTVVRCNTLRYTCDVDR